MDINKIKQVNAPGKKKIDKTKADASKTEGKKTLPSVFSDKPSNKVKKEVKKSTKLIAGVVGAVLLVAVGIFAVLSTLNAVHGGGGSDPDIVKPSDMDNGQEICQYTVRVYENIIIGKTPFVFENVVKNDADLCYSIMYKGTELYNSGWLAPGDAASWSAEEIKEQRKTYGCNIIITARDHETGAELNSVNLRQLIHIDNSLPRTTGNSAFVYSIVVDGYSKAKVVNGKTMIDYDVAVIANKLHPAEPGAALGLSVPNVVVAKGQNEYIQVITSPLKYKTQESQFIHMVGNAVIEGATGDDYTMITEYYVNVYDQNPNAEFLFETVN